MASKLFSKENITCYQAVLLPFCLGDEWKKARSFYPLSPPAYFRAFSEKKTPDTWSQVKENEDCVFMALTFEYKKNWYTLSLTSLFSTNDFLREYESYITRLATQFIRKHTKTALKTKYCLIITIWFTMSCRCYLFTSCVSYKIHIPSSSNSFPLLWRYFFIFKITTLVYKLLQFSWNQKMYIPIFLNLKPWQTHRNFLAPRK